MNIAYIALGSNIEPRVEYLQRALRMLKDHEHISIEMQSSIYETKPVGYQDQGLFLNMVAKIQTSLSPFDLLSFCQSVENTLGRKRIIRFGPRTVDLDILLYNQKRVDTENLTVPHPRMQERAFVLIPLSEIDETITFNNLSVADHIKQLSDEDCRGVTKWHQVDGD